jgi:hypothetical protein
MLIVAFSFSQPLLLRLTAFGGDWDYFCFQDEASRITILKYNQMPLWNPYASGGRPLHANPENSFLRPTFFFSLLLGCKIGLKIEIFLMVLIGMIGMYLLAKYYKMNTPSAILSSVIFCTSSYFALHFSEGHTSYVSFFWLPYIFLFFLKSLNERKYIMVSAGFFTIGLFGGNSIYFAAPILLFLGIYSAVSMIVEKNSRYMINLILFILLVGGLAAIKLLPSLEHSIDHPRVISSDETTPLDAIYDIFLNREQLRNSQYLNPQPYGWHEYGAYVGLIPVILFLVSIVIFCKEYAEILIAGVITFIISLGDFGNFSPWNLLQGLPILNQMHVPSRFVLTFVFCIALLSGLSANVLTKAAYKYNLGKVLIWSLTFFVIIDMISVSNKSLYHAFPNQIIIGPEVTPSGEFYQMVDTNPSRSGAPSSMYLNLLQNKGTLNAYDPIFISSNAVGINDTKYIGEVYLLDGGNASYVYWSPNKLVIRVSATNSTKLVVNQNYDDNWNIRTSEKDIENINGLLGTSVSNEDKLVELYYLPLSFTIGTIISIGTLLTCSYIFLRRANKTKKNEH